MRTTTFIYCLNDPRDGRLRYVGKADCPYKRWQQHLRTAHTNDHRGHWISELLSLSLKPELEVLEEIPIIGWEEIEKEYIRVFRMVSMNLVNSTDGGEGCSGRKTSEETRAKISISITGERHPLFGKHHSPEHRAKLSAANKNLIFSPGHCAKISAAKTGKKASLEARRKMSIAARSAWLRRKDKEKTI